MEIISCREARKRGLKYYYTGKSCHRGHVVKRLTKTGRCIGCEEWVYFEQWADGIKARAKKKGIEYNLSAEYLKPYLTSNFNINE